MCAYCEACGEELTPEEEDEGLCEKCKRELDDDEEYEEDEDFVDPAVT